MFLKIHGINRFETLVPVSLDSYLTDERKKGYELSKTIKSESTKEEIHIDFTFVPRSKNFAPNTVAADGFLLTYAPKR